MGCCHPWSTGFLAGRGLNLLILLGPAVEDSANGKDVYKAFAVRSACSLQSALCLVRDGGAGVAARTRPEGNADSGSRRLAAPSAVSGQISGAVIRDAVHLGAAVASVLLKIAGPRAGACARHGRRGAPTPRGGPERAMPVGVAIMVRRARRASTEAQGRPNMVNENKSH